MRLIDADEFRYEWLENGENEYVYDTNAVLDSIDAQPTIDAVPVVHGWWRFCGEDRWNDAYVCSECGKIAMDNSNYCPNCGAKMDGERRSK